MVGGGETGAGGGAGRGAGGDLASLRALVEGLAVAPTAESIVAARAVLDRFTASVAAAEAAYARDGGYEPDGFGSMASFLRFRCRAATGEARRIATRADRMGAWPEVLDAWARGEVTGTQVDTMVGEVPVRHVERFAATAAETCAILAPLNAADTRTAVRQWVAFADDVAEREAAEAGTEAPAPPAERELFVSRTTGDAAVVKGELDADSAAVTEHALRLAARPDVEGEHRSPAQRRADALVAVAQFYVDHHTAATSTRRQERLTVVCDVVTLYGSALRGAGVRTAAELEAFLAARPGLGALERGLFAEAFAGHGPLARTLEGNPIGDGLLSCISEGGVLERLLTVGSRVIDHGRSLRAHTASQWRALAAVDGGCRFPGCDDPPDRAHVHHGERWEAGGGTDLEHARLLSPHCHTIVHQPGWSERLGPDGAYTVITPSGEELTSHPRGAPPPALPVRSSAEPARPLPFDPTPSRPQAPTEGDLDGLRRTLGRHPLGERHHLARRDRADLCHGRWIVSLS